MPERIVITDVAYRGEGRDGVACAAAVVTDRWDAQFPLETHTALRTPIEDYVPGAFWQRELPCLLAVLDGLAPTLVVVDGYVWLDDSGRRGLGAHLHDAIGLPVVGVAKTAFQGSGHAAAVLRGGSARPLYVTAIGVDPLVAAERVAGMYGPYRIPTLLGVVDRLSRTGRA